MAFASVNDPPPVWSLNSLYFDNLFAQAQGLIDDGVGYLGAIADSVPPDLDLSGINLNQIDPQGIYTTLPDAPTLSGELLTPTIDDFPAPPELILADVCFANQLNDFIAMVETNFQNELDNPYILNETVENAIYSRAADKETANFAAGYENYLANQAANGWEAATGQDQSAYIYFQAKKQGALSDLGREIMIKQAEMAQNNVRHALEGLQKLQQDYGSLTVSHDGDKTRLYSAVIDGIIGKINAYSAYNKLLLDRWQAEINAYATTGRLKLEQAQILNNIINGVNGINNNLTNLALEKIRSQAQYGLARWEATTKASEAIGATLGQYAASLFNSINYGKSESMSQSWSGSESQ